MKKYEDIYILYKLDTSTPLLKTHSMEEINRYIRDKKNEALENGVKPDDYEIVVHREI